MRFVLSALSQLLEKSSRVVLVFLGSVFMARALGPEGFGVYSFAHSLVISLLPVATLGVGELVSREFVRHQDRLSVYLASSFALVVGSGLCLAVFFWAVILFFGGDWQVGPSLMVLSSLYLFSFYKILEPFYLSRASLRVLPTASILSLSVGLALKWGIFEVGVNDPKTYAIITLLEVVLYTWILYRCMLADKSAPTLSEVDVALALSMVKSSLPFVFSGFLISVYMKIDQFMILDLLGATEVGHYAVAARISESFYFVAPAVVLAIFPRVLQVREMGATEYRELLRALYCTLLVLAALFIVLVQLNASWFVRLFFGEGYFPAVGVILIHSWAALFVFIGVLSGRWLLAEGAQLYGALNTMLGAVVNIVLNYLLIPVYGIYGAAISTVLSYSISAYFCLALWPRTRENFINVSLSVFSVLQTPSTLRSVFR